LELYIDEALDDNDRYPITFEKNEFFEMELNAINHIAFSVADNPFFKL